MYSGKTKKHSVLFDFALLQRLKDLSGALQCREDVRCGEKQHILGSGKTNAHG